MGYYIARAIVCVKDKTKRMDIFERASSGRIKGILRHEKDEYIAFDDTVIAIRDEELADYFLKVGFIDCNHFANGDEELAVKLFVELAEIRDDTPYNSDFVRITTNNPHKITKIDDDRDIYFNISEDSMFISPRQGDKFHKVEPPTEEVELLAGQVYSTEFGDVSLARKVISNTNVRIFCVLYRTGVLSLNSDNGFSGTNATTLRLATPEQRQQLFDALEKAGKHFDKENMRLIDVEEWSKEHRDYPVICRHDNNMSWSVKLMCEYVKGKALVRTKSTQKQWMSQAIPYNDQTKHLIGTTDSPDKHYKFVEK